jgi:hypothetical protein
LACANAAFCKDRMESIVEDPTFPQTVFESKRHNEQFFVAAKIRIAQHFAALAASHENCRSKKIPCGRTGN